MIHKYCQYPNNSNLFNSNPLKQEVSTTIITESKDTDKSIKSQANSTIPPQI